MLFPPETWWLIAIADLDSDNGELHGPEITVHHGFVREDLMEIFKKVGFITIQNDEFDHIVGSKYRWVSTEPKFVKLKVSADF
jgi:hypothetical protein